MSKLNLKLNRPLSYDKNSSVAALRLPGRFAPLPWPACLGITGRFKRNMHLRKFFLLKAHGDAKTAAENIVLTDKDYRKLLYKEPGYQSVLQSIFTMYSVIFIGCSLQDPELKLLLNYINAAFPEGGIPHYALLSTEATGATERNRWKKDYNMRIIPISSGNNYEDIDTFLKFLHQKEDEANNPSASVK